MSVPTVHLRLARVATCALATFALASAVACKGALDVPNPQAFGDDALNNPVILKNVADGAEGLLHQAFDDFVQVTELNSDEIESTSTWIDWEDVSDGRLRHDWPSFGQYSDPQDQLLRARFAAQNARSRIEKVLGTTAAQSPLRVQVMAVDALADLLLGMGWCEGPLGQYTPRAPYTEFFKQAVTKFGEGLTAARAINNANWVNVDLAGRARANLLAGNLDAALADAQAVPAGFQYNAIYQELAQSTTGNQFHQNRNRSGGLRRLYHSRVHSIDPVETGEAYLRDWFDPTKDDHRMAVTRFEGQLGVNNRIQYYGITKYSDRNAPQRILSKTEMTLIEAEVYMKKGDYQSMADRINSLRTRPGVALPPIPTPTAANATSVLLNERMAELFVEGFRMIDLARFGQVAAILGPGRATMLPLSRTEIINNPSMKEGEGTCPGIS